MTLGDVGAHDGSSLRVLRMTGAGPVPSGPHVSTFFMIFVITEGRGRARHLELLDLEAGDVHLVPEGVEHQPLDVSGVQGWLVGFDPRLLGAFEAELPPGGLASGKVARPAPARSLLLRGLLRLRPRPERWRRIEGLVAAMADEQAEARWGAERAAHALFELLVVELMRELQEQVPLAPVTVTGIVRDALVFIERHCLEALSLQDVAAAVGRTPSHLANAIRKETGLTVGEWLRQHRMSEARRLLRATSASVEAIAGRVGYADATHFIRTFRRTHGVTPRDWRERRRGAP